MTSTNVPWQRADRLAYAATGLAVLGGLVLWPRLPAETAIHFDASSTPDDFVAKAVGVLRVPTIGVAAILLVCRGGELGGGPINPAVEDAAIGFVVAYVQGLVLA